MTVIDFCFFLKTKCRFQNGFTVEKEKDYYDKKALKNNEISIVEF